MKTCKQLANELNRINNTNNIEVVKEQGHYIIKLVYKYWTMQGMKVKTIKGL